MVQVKGTGLENKQIEAKSQEDHLTTRRLGNKGVTSAQHSVTSKASNDSAYYVYDFLFYCIVPVYHLQ